jgi:hypothetical protein
MHAGLPKLLHIDVNLKTSYFTLIRTKLSTGSPAVSKFPQQPTLYRKKHQNIVQYGPILGNFPSFCRHSSQIRLASQQTLDNRKANIIEKAI